MTIKEYKSLHNLTNRQLTGKLKEIQPELDEPLVSRMVAGIVGPSEAVADFLAKEAEKVFANGSDELFTAKGITYRPDNLTPLESAVFDRLEKATRMDPLTRQALRQMTGKDDRTGRGIIEAIRGKGGRVCSSCHAKGYWIAKDSLDYRMLRGEYLARIRKMADTVRAMDNVLEGQLKWEEQRG